LKRPVVRPLWSFLFPTWFPPCNDTVSGIIIRVHIGKFKLYNNKVVAALRCNGLKTLYLGKHHANALRGARNPLLFYNAMQPPPPIIIIRPRPGAARTIAAKTQNLRHSFMKIFLYSINALRRFLLCVPRPLLIAAVCCAGFFFILRNPGYHVFETQFYGTFDTVVVIRGYAKNEAAFIRGAEAARLRMEELHRLYDIYNAYEGVNNLRTVNQNAGIAPVGVSRDIIDMLLLAREGYELSNGAVNVAMGSVLRIWHEYREAGLKNPDSAALPDMGKLTAASGITDINDMVIDEENAAVFLRKPGMSLDVGSVAKAYAAGLALAAAEEAGLTSVLINAGGNIAASGPPLDGRGFWSVGVQRPELPADGVSAVIDTVSLRHMTLSCSGGYQRYYTVGGADYNHIIDPATLMPASRYKKVAVAHENAGLADMLSTALFILPFDEGHMLAKSLNAAALWVDNDGGWRYTPEYGRISSVLRE
jgi:thiamine biosynthesis lipoprotein